MPKSLKLYKFTGMVSRRSYIIYRIVETITTFHMKRNLHTLNSQMFQLLLLTVIINFIHNTILNISRYNQVQDWHSGLNYLRLLRCKYDCKLERKIYVIHRHSLCIWMYHSNSSSGGLVFFFN